MANPTTNYSFAMPTNTDLVKDLPADFDIFGQAVDDRIKALNPETTAGDISYRASTANAKSRLAIGTARQVLQVNSGATAPEWAASPQSVLTTTGDSLYASSANTLARLGIGTAGQVLTVNSGATAPEWATPASGGLTLINAGGTTLTGASVSITSIPTTYVNLLVIVRNFKPASDGQELNLQFNSDTGTNYSSVTANGTSLTVNTIWMKITETADDTVANGSAVTTIYDYANTATVRVADGIYWGNSDGVTTTFNARRYLGIYKSTGTAITSIQFKASSGNFTSGTVFVYGVK